MSSLTRILSEVLRLDEHKITAELAIHQIATWNSLTHIELVVMIEEAFDVQLTEDEIVAMTNVDKIQKILNGRGVLEKK
jgi:acyl carrier protein